MNQGNLQTAIRCLLPRDLYLRLLRGLESVCTEARVRCQIKPQALQPQISVQGSSASSCKPSGQGSRGSHSRKVRKAVLSAEQRTKAVYAFVFMSSSVCLSKIGVVDIVWYMAESHQRRVINQGGAATGSICSTDANHR